MPPTITRLGPYLLFALLLAACAADDGLLPTSVGLAMVPAASFTPSPTSLPNATTTSTATTEPTATVMPTTAPTHTATATATSPPTATPSPTSTASATPAPTPEPYLQQYTLVSFYGSAEGAGMGILNFREPPQLLAELRQRAAEYQALLPDKQVLPAFHIIVTVADPTFGEDRNFNHHLSLDAVESWLQLAARENIAVVLDIQPGHASVQEEFERIRPYLYDPHVHLALDSEYTMERSPGGLYEVPGDVLGSLYAAQIDPIQAQLDEIAREIGHNKVLILHQFESEMLPDKENIDDFDHVELVIDSDGFGGPDKVRDYHQYAGEPAFEYGGIKLYRNWDNPLLSPPDVLNFQPPPAVIIYQ